MYIAAVCTVTVVTGLSAQRPDPIRAASDAGAGAWLVAVGAGTVNTTLHDEHGILSALLLGLWLSRHPPARAS
jgi:hypothetical protein